MTDADFHTVKMAPLPQQDILAEVFVFHSSEVFVAAETLAASPMKLENLLDSLEEYVTLGSAVNANAVILATFLMKIWSLTPTSPVLVNPIYAMISSVVNVTVGTIVDFLTGKQLHHVKEENMMGISDTLWTMNIVSKRGVRNVLILESCEIGQKLEN